MKARYYLKPATPSQVDVPMSASPPEISEKPARLLHSTSIVGGMTLLSRVSGLVRDVVFSRVFGASPVMDAFFVAFKIPNLLRRFFSEGAFAQAFVPLLAEYRVKRSRAELQPLIDGDIPSALARARTDLARDLLGQVLLGKDGTDRAGKVYRMTAKPDGSFYGVKEISSNWGGFEHIAVGDVIDGAGGGGEENGRLHGQSDKGGQQHG